MVNRSLLFSKLKHHLEFIYADVPLKEDPEILAIDLLELMRLNVADDQPKVDLTQLWDQSDAILITYADSVKKPGKKPLKTLAKFLRQRVDGLVNSIHILPFYPYSSDDGFAVIDYSSVNETHGTWEDIEDIARDYRLMADLVINHGSSRSLWFSNFVKGLDPGSDYFFTAAADADLGAVVRPRTNPILRETETARGTRYVWCTFSHDQVDFDFRNPEVLKEFVRIIRLYLDRGVQIFRLDAIAFLWKKVGTSCLNLDQTHEVVRLLRTLIEQANPKALIITETNIPNRENLSYFGNANEAHCIYNFPLPPLLVNTLITGDCYHLKQWLMSMPPPQQGTAYFNLIATHDGIGLRPVDGLLSSGEIETLVETMQQFGGRISWRTSREGIDKPYEVNISLFDALSGTVKGKDHRGVDRFVCAHAIMLGMEGIPGIYLHSLLGTRNDYRRVENTGHNRSINRHQWDYDALCAALDSPDSQHSQVFDRLGNLLQIRASQPAFHPNATQFTLQLGRALFGFWRHSLERHQSIFCISNISDTIQTLSLTDINLIELENWFDLISGQEIEDRTGTLALNPYQTLWITNHR